MNMLRHMLYLLIAITLAAAAHANRLDELLVELKGPDEAARAHARQLLPREGIDALPSLLPLINHESEPVWRATYNVVAVIVNEACAFGYETDRARATDLLAQWLASDQTPRAQEYGLRLIMYVVPPDYPVDSIVPFLNHEDLREYARGALEIIGSDAARLALEAAYPAADPVFKLALLHSLRHIAHKSSQPFFIQAMDDGDPAIRAAAACAAAQFGGADAAPHFLQVQAGATPETAFDATDAVLRYADALATGGGNWALAMATYIQVLANVEDPVLICGAMMGLGRYGDEHVIPVLLEKARTSPSAKVAPTLPMALAALEGRAATEQIVAHYDDIPLESRATVVRAIGARPISAAVELVARELNNSDPQFRKAALDAASHQTAMELLAPLMVRVEEGEDAERAAALRAALSIARAGASAGAPAEAGAALVRLYAHALDDATRVEILQAISNNPVVDALPLAKEALAVPALADAATNALVALTKPLVASGDEEQAREVFSLVMSVQRSPETIVALASQMGAAAAGTDLTQLLGTVRTWHLIGPFPWKEDADWERPFVNEPSIDLGATINGHTWKEVTSADTFGMVNLIEHLGQHDRVFGYAYATVNVPKGGEAQLRMGSDDGIVAWVNGEKVWENRVDRGATVDSDVAPIQLMDGENTILLKISQGAGGWNFCCRLTDADGIAYPRS